MAQFKNVFSPFSSVLLCAVLCAGIFAACGSAPAAPADPDSPAAPAPKADAPIELNKTEISLLAGDNDIITVKSAHKVSWASDKEDVATVDENGGVTAHTPGLAIITASSGNKTAQCIVHVRLLNMVKIDGGTYLMGSPTTERQRSQDELPQHEVTLSDFYICIYLITQFQYKVVTDADPSHFKGENLPVESVSWYDALIFCNKLSIIEGLQPAYSLKGKTDPADWGDPPAKWDTKSPWNNDFRIVDGSDGYRLPTEAQWEYACRAGTDTPFYTGLTLSSQQANFDGRTPYLISPRGPYREKTTDVDFFDPNPWGLYDMHGNVWEWCWDWHGLYTNTDGTDPQGSVDGRYRIARGGAWEREGRFLRSGSRGNSDPAAKMSHTGFRVVRP